MPAQSSNVRFIQVNKSPLEQLKELIKSYNKIPYMTITPANIAMIKHMVPNIMRDIRNLVANHDEDGSLGELVENELQIFRIPKDILNG